MNTHELAWAAGFFDGEGSAGAYFHRASKRLSLDINVTQVDRRVLDRFQVALLGIGRISRRIPSNPNARPIYTWHSRSFEGFQATMAMLWQFLSPVKRAQLLDAQRRYLSQPPSSRTPRPWIKTPSLTARVRALRETGLTYQATAAQLGVSRSTALRLGSDDVPFA
jgi:hypothetical protein